MRRSRSLHVWGQALADLALPVSCPGCGAPHVSLCPGCGRHLLAPTRRVSPPAWLSPPAGSPTTPPVWAGPDYAAPASRVIVAWKDRGRLDLTPALAACLARTVTGALDADRAAPTRAPLLLVPAPSTAAAVRRRGEDVVALLARTAADLVRSAHGPGGGGRPGPSAVRVLPALRLHRGVADQAGLGAGQRRRNVSGRVRLALGCRPLLAGRRVLLVDDVVTTGATAAAAVRALQGAGAIVVGACVVCATPRGNRQGAGVSGAIQVD